MKKNTVKQLPQTGHQQDGWFYILGVGLLSIASYLSNIYLFKKKHK